MLTLYFDGLFRKVFLHPKTDLKSAGLMCYGWIVFRGSVAIARGFGGVLDDPLHASSNAAEFHALVEGLEALKDMGAANEPIRIIGDAKSVIDQMRGYSEVNALNSKAYYIRALRLSQGFKNLTWQWSPRRHNCAADGLTRHALRQLGASRTQIPGVVELSCHEALRAKRQKGPSQLLDLRVFQATGLSYLPG